MDSNGQLVDDFGTWPVRNYNYNMMVDVQQGTDSPWFDYAQYSNYYCLLIGTWKQEAAFFGLTDDGHFVAYTLADYDWMHFYTSPVGLLYGHLVVSYDGTVTPWFRKFIAGNNMVRTDDFDLTSNLEQMRVQYVIHNLQWDSAVEEYWRDFSKSYILTCRVHARKCGKGD